MEEFHLKLDSGERRFWHSISEARQEFIVYLIKCAVEMELDECPETAVAHYEEVLKFYPFQSVQDRIEEIYSNYFEGLTRSYDDEDDAPLQMDLPLHELIGLKYNNQESVGAALDGDSDDSDEGIMTRSSRKYTGGRRKKVVTKLALQTLIHSDEEEEVDIWYPKAETTSAKGATSSRSRPQRKKCLSQHSDDSSCDKENCCGNARNRSPSLVQDSEPDDDTLERRNTLFAKPTLGSPISKGIASIPKSPPSPSTPSSLDSVNLKSTRRKKNLILDDDEDGFDDNNPFSVPKEEGDATFALNCAPQNFSLSPAHLDKMPKNSHIDDEQQLTTISPKRKASDTFSQLATEDARSSPLKFHRLAPRSNSFPNDNAFKSDDDSFDLFTRTKNSISTDLERKRNALEKTRVRTFPEENVNSIGPIVLRSAKLEGDSKSDDTVLSKKFLDLKSDLLSRRASTGKLPARSEPDPDVEAEAMMIISSSDGEDNDLMSCKVNAFNMIMQTKQSCKKKKEVSDDDLVDLDNGYKIPRTIHSRLKNYQVEGVQWLWDSFKNEKIKGCLLGDDMGLGKTVQTVAFLGSLFKRKLIKNALLVLPASLIQNWVDTFSNWYPYVSVRRFHGAGDKISYELKQIQKYGGVCLTSYSLVKTRLVKLKNLDFEPFTWDYLVLDEGHFIKNCETKTWQSLKSLKAHHKILLTGTPIQNNYSEVWALFDFICDGKLLGEKDVFKHDFVDPILQGSEGHCSEETRAKAEKKIEELYKLLKPYLLRREKKKVLTDMASCSTVGGSNSDNLKVLSRKMEFVVWTKLSESQEEAYRTFARSWSPLFMNALCAVQKLKTLCTHLSLFDPKLPQFQKDLSVEEITDCSSKMKVIQSLLRNLKEKGHRVIVFSQSLVVLTYIGKLIRDMGAKCLRIDGKMRDVATRVSVVETFNRDKSYFVLLSSLKVGGVGFTINGADRVIIVDPSWNPSDDKQAVDRAYRIGQTKDVVTYRFLTCGTVEEKLYRIQLFKESLQSNVLNGGSKPIRFSGNELKNMLRLDDFNSCLTYERLKEFNNYADLTDEVRQHVYGDLTDKNGVFGITFDYILRQEMFKVSKILQDQREQEERARKKKGLSKNVASTSKVKTVEQVDEDISDLESIEVLPNEIVNNNDDPFEIISDSDDQFSFSLDEDEKNADDDVIELLSSSDREHDVLEFSDVNPSSDSRSKPSAIAGMTSPFSNDTKARFNQLGINDADEDVVFSPYQPKEEKFDIFLGADHLPKPSKDRQFRDNPFVDVSESEEEEESYYTPVDE